MPDFTCHFAILQFPAALFEVGTRNNILFLAVSHLVILVQLVLFVFDFQPVDTAGLG